MKIIPYGRQQISDEDINSVVSVLRSDFLTQGPKTSEFEELFSKYVRSKYALAVANGTAALHLSVLGLDLQPNQKVLTTPITFAASANCILYAGAKVEFVDIDPSEWLIDLNKVEEALRKDVKGEIRGIIPVDFAGLPVNMEDLYYLSQKHNLWILEDSCHAPGAYFFDSKGNKSYAGSCNYTDSAIFSFHPVKHIATGEGGMVTTKNQTLYEKISKLRTHGITKNLDELSNKDNPQWYHEMQELGYNYRLSDIHAALGISQLSVAGRNIERRNLIAKRYREALKDLPVQFQKVTKGKYHAYHLMVILSEKRDELFSYLREKSIYCQIHYIPVYKHPYYQQNGYAKVSLSVAEDYYQKCISLPLYPSISDEELEYVITCVQSFFDK